VILKFTEENWLDAGAIEYPSAGDVKRGAKILTDQQPRNYTDLATYPTDIH
jgi:hypothetical protein